jgi:hypothetical protein
MRSEFRRLRILAAALCAAAAGLGAGTASAQSQAQTSSTAATAQSKTKTQVLKFHGEVMSANSATITVRSTENGRDVMTFSYAPKVQQKMQGLIQRGGYQYGDKVTVKYNSGTTVALDISGRASKPKNL